VATVGRPLVPFSIRNKLKIKRIGKIGSITSRPICGNHHHRTETSSITYNLK
jgi:hypothetical protein